MYLEHKESVIQDISLACAEAMSAGREGGFEESCASATQACRRNPKRVVDETGRLGRARSRTRAALLQVAAISSSLDPKQLVILLSLRKLRTHLCSQRPATIGAHFQSGGHVDVHHPRACTLQIVVAVVG